MIGKWNSEMKKGIWYERNENYCNIIEREDEK